MRLGRVRFERKYVAIRHFHAENGWSIRWMCHQLRISKAAYYKWLHRSVPQAEQENLVLAELILEYDERYNHILGYCYEPNLLTLTLSERSAPIDAETATWLFLPMARAQLDRAILRAGIMPEDREFRFQESYFPNELDAALQFETEDIYDLNALCEVCARLTEAALIKLGAVCQMAKPENFREIRQLAENLDQFDFAPKVHTPTELGQYMIRESLHYDYDPNLDEFYNYEQYGLQKLAWEHGEFTDRGYVSYHGTMTLDELMADDPAEAFRQDREMQLGGMM